MKIKKIDMKRLVLTEEEKNRILGLHGSNLIMDTNSLTGIIRGLIIQNRSAVKIAIKNDGIIGDGGVKGNGLIFENGTSLRC